MKRNHNWRQTTIHLQQADHNYSTIGYHRIIFDGMTCQRNTQRLQTYLKMPNQEFKKEKEKRLVLLLIIQYIFKYTLTFI